jgi:hypothetical protein
VWASSRGQRAGLPASVIIPGRRRKGHLLHRATSERRGAAGRPGCPLLVRARHALTGICNPCTWLTAPAAVSPPSYHLTNHAARRHEYATRTWSTYGWRPASGTPADCEQARLPTSRLPAATTTILRIS